MAKNCHTGDRMDVVRVEISRIRRSGWRNRRAEHRCDGVSSRLFVKYLWSKKITDSDQANPFLASNVLEFIWHIGT